LTKTGSKPVTVIVSILGEELNHIAAGFFCDFDGAIVITGDAIDERLGGELILPFARISKRECGTSGPR
jgi:hypothetical protein